MRVVYCVVGGILFFLVIISPCVFSAENILFFPKITFNSFLEITPDASIQNDFVPIEEKVKIPITIEYQTTIPEDFLSILPPFLQYKFLFGSFSPPQQHIQLTLSDAPNWGTFTLNPSDFSEEIPYGNNKISKTVNLTMELSENAPCKRSSIRLKAECKDIKRLHGCANQINITFTPEYIPCITVSGNQKVHAPPMQQTSVLVHVKNCGNKQSMITLKTTSDVSDLGIVIIQPQETINVSDETVFNISVNPSGSFKGEKTIDINFTSQIFPLQLNTPKSSVNHQITFYHKDTNNEDYDSNNPYWTIIVIIFIGSIILILGRYKKYW